MTTVLPPFADAEEVAWRLLRGVAGLPDKYVVTYLDDKWTPEAGDRVLVQRIGGGDDGTTDRARIGVTVFGTTRPRSRQIAEECRQRILACGGTAVEGVLIDKATTETAAVEVPGTIPDGRVLPAVYRLELRRPRS